MDSAPRKRRIVEEPPEPARPPEPVAPPEPVPPPKPMAPPKSVAQPQPARVKPQRATPAPPPQAEPPSPRTLLRYAGETIYQLQSQRDNARRDFWAQQIDKTLR